MTVLTRRTLRAMQRRWQADLERLEQAYGEFTLNPEQSNPESETQRNLATAIAEIRGMIAHHRPGKNYHEWHVSLPSLRCQGRHILPTPASNLHCASAGHCRSLIKETAPAWLRREFPEEENFMKRPIKKSARASSVEAHHYNPETGHLTVTFRGGRQYRYEGVDQKTADGLAGSESKGRFLHSSVIGKFDATKI
jgi:hypothetical protein